MTLNAHWTLAESGSAVEKIKKRVIANILIKADLVGKMFVGFAVIVFIKCLYLNFTKIRKIILKILVGFFLLKKYLDN